MMTRTMFRQQTLSANFAALGMTVKLVEFSPRIPAHAPIMSHPRKQAPMPNEECFYCNEEALGHCENCEVPICAFHDSGEFDDVVVCSDELSCAENLED